MPGADGGAAKSASIPIGRRLRGDCREEPHEVLYLEIRAFGAEDGIPGWNRVHCVRTSGFVMRASCRSCLKSHDPAKRLMIKGKDWSERRDSKTSDSLPASSKTPLQVAIHQ